MAVGLLVEPEEREAIDLVKPHPLGPDPCETLIEIDINKIVFDAGSQPRDGQIDLDVLKDFVDAQRRGDMFPPIRVVHDTLRDLYVSWDGHTRTKSGIKAGKKTIKAYCRIGRIYTDKPTGEQKSTAVKDAVLLSASANRTHGQRRKQGDIRRAVIRLFDFKEIHDWTDKAIADYVECSSSVVGSIRRELGIDAAGDGPRRRAVPQADGTKKYINVVAKERTPKAEPIKSTPEMIATPALVFPSRLGFDQPSPLHRTASSPLLRLERMLRDEGVSFEMNVRTNHGHVHAVVHTTQKVCWAENTLTSRQVCEIAGRMLVLRELLGKYRDYGIQILGQPDADATYFINKLRDIKVITHRPLGK